MPSGRDTVPSGKAPAGIEPRRLMWAVAEVCWADPAGRPLRSRATIVDISPSGACIRLKERIGVGSPLTIKWHREQFAATARNCRADGQDYLLGVHREASLETAPEAPRANAAPPPAAAPPTPGAVAATNAAQANATTEKAEAVPAALPKPAPAPEPVRELAAALKTIPLRAAPEREQKSAQPPSRASNLEPLVRRPRPEAAGQERTDMQPKRLFPKFWRGQQEAHASDPVATKENPVNKPSTHVIEHVSNPPTHLLSYEDIYHAAGLMNPRSGYGIRKVVEMLNSERIRGLAKDVQRASVLMALDAAGASVDDLLQDATARQQALNSYEDAQRKQLEEFEARKTQENAQIDAEMRRITAHYAERIQQNQDEVTRHKEALHDWQMAKQHESQRISEVMELCGKQAAGPASAMAAAAGTGATQLAPKS